MTARLYSVQAIPAAPAVQLIPGGANVRAFASVSLDGDGLTHISFGTPAEAYALRDACQRAGDLLAEAEALHDVAAAGGDGS